MRVVAPKMTPAVPLVTLGPPAMVAVPLTPRVPMVYV